MVGVMVAEAVASGPMGQPALIKAVPGLLDTLQTHAMAREPAMTTPLRRALPVICVTVRVQTVGRHVQAISIVRDHCGSVTATINASSV